MKQVFKRPESLIDVPFHFCPGCHHGIIHRLVAECIDAYDLREKTICAASVGCSVFMYDYFDVDVCESPHGRAAAVATGIKRARPDNFVFTYQGDGDLASIGIAESLHCANRGEDITIIFVNNTVYGMTGGQMAPTTMLGMKTTTSPFGRDGKLEGHPIKMSEILAQVQGSCYVERVAVSSPANIRKAKKAIKKAFQNQIDGKGYSLVEILSPCPTNWKMSPVKAWQWVDEVMSKEFPLGLIKDTTG